MRRRESTEEPKRIMLRIEPALWRRVRIEAVKRDMSATLLINQVLEKGVTELEAEAQ